MALIEVICYNDNKRKLIDTQQIMDMKDVGPLECVLFLDGSDPIKVFGEVDYFKSKIAIIEQNEYKSLKKSKRK